DVSLRPPLFPGIRPQTRGRLRGQRLRLVVALVSHHLLDDRLLLGTQQVELRHDDAGQHRGAVGLVRRVSKQFASTGVDWKRDGRHTRARPRNLRGGCAPAWASAGSSSPWAPPGGLAGWPKRLPGARPSTRRGAAGGAGVFFPRWASHPAAPGYNTPVTLHS